MLPERLTPDYWIDMGVLAITTLAGTLLLSASNHWRLLQELGPFLTGSAFVFWATATWWIPLLLVVELWRHFCGRVAFAYRPEYWSLVFPLGMYSTASSMLGTNLNLRPVIVLGEIFLYAALVAWTLTFAGLAHRRIKCIRPRAARPTKPARGD